MFGPSQAAAELEASKRFTKEICDAANAPTAGYAHFTEAEPARAYIRENGAPIVVKADGLAAGKGVVVADTAAKAEEAAAEMLDGRFGDAGATLLVEERITGPEASLFALVDGADVLFMGSAQDHKRAYDGDKGPNTGGMGAVSPSPRLTNALQQQVMDEIVRPLARGMADEGTPYRGILYVGLMLTGDGPQVIEFNCRLGDPEAQVILPRLRSDLVAAMLATVEGTLGHVSLRWDERSAVTVVMAAKGYPGDYEKGSVISGTKAAETSEDVMLFHAGTKIDEAGTVTAHGGRVLAVTGLGDDAGAARSNAYAAVDTIDWPGGFCRRDIAAG